MVREIRILSYYVIQNFLSLKKSILEGDAIAFVNTSIVDLNANSAASARAHLFGTFAYHRS